MGEQNITTAHRQGSKHESEENEENRGDNAERDNKAVATIKIKRERQTVRPIQMLDGGPESFNPLNPHPRDTNLTTPPPRFFTNRLPFTFSLSRSQPAESPLGIAGCPLFGFNFLLNPTPMPFPFTLFPFNPEPKPLGLYLDSSSSACGPPSPQRLWPTQWIDIAKGTRYQPPWFLGHRGRQIPRPSQVC